MLQGKKILLIEDDLSIRRMYERYFEREGAEFFSTHDGVEGLKRLQKESFHILLVDLIMPKVNGYEIVKKVREDFKMKDIPIIVLTNLTSGFEQYIDKVRNLGIQGYIIKSDVPMKEQMKQISSTLQEAAKGI